MSKSESNGVAVDLISEYTDLRHAHEERYENGHPFTKIVLAGLEDAVKARGLGALEARVERGVPGYDQHVREHPQIDMAEAA